MFRRFLFDLLAVQPFVHAAHTRCISFSGSHGNRTENVFVWPLALTWELTNEFTPFDCGATARDVCSI